MAADKPKPIKLTTPEFRGSFVTLDKPRAIPGSEGAPKYSMLIVLAKDHPETAPFLAKLRKAIEQTIVAKFGKAMPEKSLKHFPIKDGSDMEQEGFADCWCISVSNKFKPGVVDLKGNKLISPEDVYSGAWYRASISPWAWSHKVGGKGVSINLDNVLKVRDDEKFGGGSKAEDDFADFIDKDGDTPAEEAGNDEAADLLGDDEPPY